MIGLTGESKHVCSVYSPSGFQRARLWISDKLPTKGILIVKPRQWPKRCLRIAGIVIESSQRPTTVAISDKGERPVKSQAGNHVLNQETAYV